MILVRGADSAVACALQTLEPISAVPRNHPMPEGQKYLFCVGLIRQRRITDQSTAEMADTFTVNAINVMRECDWLIERNPQARICIVGSESGFKGSFDMAYAAAKAGLHKYVETRRLKYPGQQLVCVAPTCVVNTNMNRQRNADGVAALEARRLKHPKQRWLEPIEVARMIHFLLSDGNDYTTNCVIRMNGGEHCG